MWRHSTRCAVVVAGAALFAGLGATAASAHVTVDPGTAAQGSYAALVFRVPNERDDADTVKVDVRLPPDRPVAAVSVKPHPGWSYEVKKAKPATSLKGEDGGAVTEVVSEVIWTADDKKAGIGPGEYDEFAISAGPLPKAGSMTFKALQYYSDGAVVRWIQEPSPNGPEPERPGPVLRLLPPAAGAGNPAAARPAADPAGPAAAATGGAGVPWAVGLAAAALVVAIAAAAVAIRAARR